MPTSSERGVWTASHDGDATTDLAVFRNGVWYIEGQPTVYLGSAGDIPVPVTTTGTGRRPGGLNRSGAWYTDGQQTVYNGLNGDVPLPLSYAIRRTLS